MKAVINLVAAFVTAPVQFIIGVFLVAGKANITTIGWYYVFASTFMVVTALVGVIALAVRGAKDL